MVGPEVARLALWLEQTVALYGGGLQACGEETGEGMAIRSVLESWLQCNLGTVLPEVCRIFFCLVSVIYEIW